VGGSASAIFLAPDSPKLRNASRLKATISDRVALARGNAAELSIVTRQFHIPQTE
jgi:hypothetical protein